MRCLPVPFSAICTVPTIGSSQRAGQSTTAAPAMAERIMFVTGDVAGTEAEKFLEESGCRWLAKPFRLAELLRAVKERLS